MKKIILSLILTIVQLAAVEPAQLYGEWVAQREANINGSINSVYEDLTINPGSFMVVRHITIQKDDYLIRDLQVRGSGTWKVSGDTLVYVINEVYTVGVQEARGISQEEINQLARDIHQKYLGDPIRIIKIQSISSDRLVTANESGAIRQHRRK